MRTSKNSRTKGHDNPFRSRFEGDADMFPLRQYMRCREEIAHRVILSLVQAGFLVALIYLAFAIHRAFERHGTSAAAWIEPATLVLVAVVMLSLTRKMLINIRESLRVRKEMKRLTAEIKSAKDEAGSQDGTMAP
jgi:cytochrome c oxidase subunit IV